jgi:hypothetical protein
MTHSELSGGIVMDLQDEWADACSIRAELEAIADARATDTALLFLNRFRAIVRIAMSRDFRVKVLAKTPELIVKEARRLKEALGVEKRRRESGSGSAFSILPRKFCDMFCAFTPPVTVRSEVRKARAEIALSTAHSVCGRGQVRALLDQSEFETGFERGKRR